MNIHSHSLSKPSRRGFTLVEVLVSSLLTLMVLGMLFSILIGTINAYDGGTARLESSGDARLAFDILKTDLESMVVRQTQYNQEWMVSAPVDVNGIQSSWLLFFAPSLDRDEGQDGDIVALSYLVDYQDPISPSEINRISGLYKAMTNTTNTFENVLGQTNILTGYWTNTTPAPDPLPSDRSGFLAPNVVKFDVVWLIRDLSAPSTGLLRVGPDSTVRLGNQLFINGTVNGSPVNGFVNAKIEAVDVTLTTISNEGMKRYSFFEENGQEAGKLEQIIREYGRVFTQRIPISY